MRFIGNKEKLLEKIYNIVLKIGNTDGSFCDFFSGTSNVGRYLKQKGYSIISSDLLYFSFVLQKAYIENNSEPSFTKILKFLGIYDTKAKLHTPLELVIEYLNEIKGVEGFIYKNYTEEGTKNGDFLRKYFLGENGKKIDAIRQTIENWNTGHLVTELEYYILLACLIESVPFYANISGVYAAFLKQYDPRALKPFRIRPIQINESKKSHRVFNKNSMELTDGLDIDILYLDPPYNSRQYAPNYHLLETIAKYDSPEIKGVTGMRNYEMQRSEFCNPKTGLLALDRIAQKAKHKHLLLSYNSEGIMPQTEIVNVLKKYGNVEIQNIDYLRYKSNSNGDSKHKKIIQEQIFILQKV